MPVEVGLDEVFHVPYVKHNLRNGNEKRLKYVEPHEVEREAEELFGIYVVSTNAGTAESPKGSHFGLLDVRFYASRIELAGYLAWRG